MNLPKWYLKNLNGLQKYCLSNGASLKSKGNRPDAPVLYQCAVFCPLHNSPSGMLTKTRPLYLLKPPIHISSKLLLPKHPYTSPAGRKSPV